jgi:hypothetical protein
MAAKTIFLIADWVQEQRAPATTITLRSLNQLPTWL